MFLIDKMALQSLFKYCYGTHIVLFILFPFGMITSYWYVRCIEALYIRLCYAMRFPFTRVINSYKTVVAYVAEMLRIFNFRNCNIGPFRAQLHIMYTFFFKCYIFNLFLMFMQSIRCQYWTFQSFIWTT